MSCSSFNNSIAREMFCGSVLNSPPLKGTTVHLDVEQIEQVEPQCIAPLGMESGAILDADITASSSFDSGNVGPHHGRVVKDGPKFMIIQDYKEIENCILKRKEINSKE
ncbi:hypothetical protein WN51_00101 [Melipona quadrifasciata]|uniref:Uncharacterized protein n=1 Tax=Melipona quadrifasciata TaxID=166423 RepID=A0A0N1IU81_9HYME|nr:hypothetical protein WN51_00101 [Melipona quadrifasciata]